MPPVRCARIRREPQIFRHRLRLTIGERLKALYDPWLVAALATTPVVALMAIDFMRR